MSLLALVLVLVAIGIGLWALNTYVTVIDSKIKQLINVVVIVVAVFLVLNAFGIIDAMRSVVVPRVGG